MVEPQFLEGIGNKGCYGVFPVAFLPDGPFKLDGNPGCAGYGIHIGKDNDSKTNPGRFAVRDDAVYTGERNQRS